MASYLKQLTDVEVIKQNTIDTVYAPLPDNFQGTQQLPLDGLDKALLPLKAIGYFFTNPSLWMIVICPMLCTAAVAIIGLLLVFGLLLYPQELFFEKTCDFPVWAAWLMSVFLCLIESLIFIVVQASLFLEGTRKRVYDKVFRLHGMEPPSSKSKPQRTNTQTNSSPHTNPDGSISNINSNSNSNTKSGCCSTSTGCFDCCCLWCCQDMFQSVGDCFFVLLSPAAMWRCACQRTISWTLFLLTAPLNLIPVLGTIAFCVINGTWMAFRMQSSFFVKKGLNSRERFTMFRTRIVEFMAFGTVCMALDMIPLADIVLIYTNVVASALWAVEMERSGLIQSYTFLSSPSDLESASPVSVPLPGSHIEYPDYDPKHDFAIDDVPHDYYPSYIDSDSILHH